MKQAEALIGRILFLDGTPSMTELLHLNVGQNVMEQIERDLKLEINAAAMYNASIQISPEAAGNTSPSVVAFATRSPFHTYRF